MGGRILVDMKSLVLGGLEVNAVQFAAEVRNHGYESILVAPAESRPVGPSIHDVAADYNLRIREYPRQSRVLAGARLLANLAKEERADIVHVYGQRRMRAAYLGPCKFGIRPLVVTAYEMEVYPFTLHGAHLIVGTQYLAEEQVGHPGGTTFISPPVDLDRDTVSAVDGRSFRQSIGLDPSQILVVWVGRLAFDMKSNAVRALIDAASEIKNRNVVFLIVGTGEAEQELRARAASVNLRLGREAVRFGGPMSDPRPAYAAADIQVGMGSSAARGLAFERALVAVGEAGWARRFEPATANAIFRNSFWSNDYVANSGKVLANQLTPLIDNVEFRERLGRFGLQFAIDNFSLKGMASKLAGAYDQASIRYGFALWASDLDLEAAVVSHRIYRGNSEIKVGEEEYRVSKRFGVRRGSGAQGPLRSATADIRDGCRGVSAWHNVERP